MKLYNIFLELFCPNEPDNSVLAVLVKSMQKMHLPVNAPFPIKAKQDLAPTSSGDSIIFSDQPEERKGKK